MSDTGTFVREGSETGLVRQGPLCRPVRACVGDRSAPSGVARAISCGRPIQLIERQRKDVSGWSAPTRRLTAFLSRPGVLPRSAIVLVIGGIGHSDHVSAFRATRAMLAARGVPACVYWGYGRDPTVLDPVRPGVPVAFRPNRVERGFKRWAIDV